MHEHVKGVGYICPTPFCIALASAWLVIYDGAVTLEGEADVCR